MHLQYHFIFGPRGETNPRHPSNLREFRLWIANHAGEYYLALYSTKCLCQIMHPLARPTQSLFLDVESSEFERWDRDTLT